MLHENEIWLALVYDMREKGLKMTNHPVVFLVLCILLYRESAFAKFSESKQINVVVMLQILYKYNCVNLVPTYQLELYFYFSYIIYS